MPVRTGFTGRQIRDAWNALVPQARAQGLNVNEWQLPPETRAYGLRRLEWLRGQLASTTSATPVQALPTAGADVLGNFTFGVELECYIPATMTHQSLARELTLAGVNCAAEIYSHNVQTAWK